MISMRRN